MAKSLTKKTPLRQIQLPEGVLHQVQLAFIIPDPNQPRRHFDETKLNELAASIAAIGVMQPIVVHPNDAGGYDIICGERRYRGSIIAGKEKIPAMVYPRLSEDVVRELQIMENLHRQDMNPMEESDSFFDLTKRGMTTADDIARRIGKSEKYVYDRLSLQQCIILVQDLIRKGTLPISHGKQFARLNLDDQQELYELLVNEDEVSLSDIKYKINRHFSMVLDTAPFDIQRPDLVPHASDCASCPKRSGCNGLLFDDVSSKDICFDKTCYDSKVEVHINEEEKKLREEGKTVHRIFAQYVTELPAGALAYNHYDLYDVDTVPDAYGIVMRSGYKVNNVAVGSVVGINYTSSGRDFLGLPSEDEADSDDSQTSNNSRNSVQANSKEYIDHDELFTKRIFRTLLSKFNDNPQSISINDLVLKAIIDKFSYLDDHNFIYVCETAGWTIVKDTDDADEISVAGTLAIVYNNMEYGAHYLLDLAAQLNECEVNYWQRQDIQRILNRVPDIHVDIAAEMDAYEQETGHKFND